MFVTGKAENTMSPATNAPIHMPIVIAVPKELAPGEQRVATVPEIVQNLTKSGYEVRIEHDAGTGAYYPDDLYHSRRCEDRVQPD